ncbi:MAG: phosphomethylpyrimidine synthase ThiC, partial [Caldisericota bacterium]|nr:phosphomethylpyrimidine synthase ThiC [Caldisericota bacterium]
MTQLELAKAGIISPQLEQVAQHEKLDVNTLQQGIAEGKIIILANLRHSNSTPCGIGKGLKTKVNANIGTSSDLCDVNLELKKLRMAIDTGANTIMDLSTGGDISSTRQTIIANSTIPVGTVPIYQAGLEAIEKHKALVNMKVDEIFNVIENQVKDGVDFITVHCGVTQASIARLKNEGRITSIVSRGGAFLTGWILHNGQENPLFQYYDRLLDIAHEYDVTLSLGDGLRPGCLADATDRAQVEELIILGEMVDRARKAGVQAMVEGPGHLPLAQIVSNVELEKSLCHEAPFYVLGPLVTDIGAGYDHITGAIGGAIAAAAGTDFLCYVTPAEHLSLPDVDNVKQGVIASCLAAHVGDIAKGVADAKKRDEHMARARKDLNWE